LVELFHHDLTAATVTAQTQTASAFRRSFLDPYTFTFDVVVDDDVDVSAVVLVVRFVFAIILWLIAACSFTHAIYLEFCPVDGVKTC
jgi:hypothetical protein